MFKKIIVSTIIILIVTSIAFSQKKLTAETVLQKSLDKINKLKTVKYQHNLELNYPSQSYLVREESESFIDFTETDNLVKARYQFGGKDNFITFNGSAYFSLNKTKKTINVVNKPNEGNHGKGAFRGSLISLRTLFPKLIADKSIIKTLSQTKLNYIVEFYLEKQWIDGYGNIMLAENGVKQLYRITITKKNLLEVEFIRNLNDTDFIKTNISKVILNPTKPSYTSWNVSNYQDEYQPEKPRKKQISVGEIAPEITLTSFETNQKDSLSNYKGKVVLLEFWTFYCGICIAAMPKLNELNVKFKDKNFKMIGINKGDSESKIALFKEKFKPNFEFWTGGDKVADEIYSIRGTPMAILIDKEEKIIFSEGFVGNEAKIEELIKQNL